MRVLICSLIDGRKNVVVVSMKTKIPQIRGGLAAVNQKPAPHLDVMITAYSASVRVAQCSATNMHVVYFEYWYFKRSGECGRICHLEYGSWGGRRLVIG